MDGALLGSVDLALKTSQTSYLWPTSSHRHQRRLNPLMAMVDTERTMFTAEVSNGGLVAIGGGEALVNSNDEHVGSVGVNAGLIDSEINWNLAMMATQAFIAAGGSSVGVSSNITQQTLDSYKSGFIAALVLAILFGLVLIALAVRYYFRGDSETSGYKPAPK